MFLLAAALAALADGASTRAARAAGHELRQRLGGPPETEAANVEPEPPLEANLILERFIRESERTIGSGWQGWARVENRLRSIVFRLYSHIVPQEAIGTVLIHVGAGARMIPSLPQGGTSGFSHAYAEATEVLRAVLLRPGPCNGQWLAMTTAPSVVSVLDWLHDDATARIGDRTWPELVARATAWHHDLVGAGFRGAIPDAWVVARDRDGWTLQRLTEKQDLADEGTSMGHCIGGPDRGGGRRDGESRYWQLARDDQAVLLSLRDPSGVPQITIEAAPNGRLRQVQGPEDRVPTQEAIDRLKRVMHAIGGDRVIWGTPNLWTPIALTDGPEGWDMPGNYMALFLFSSRVDRLGEQEIWDALSHLNALMHRNASLIQTRFLWADKKHFRSEHPTLTMRGYMGDPSWPIWIGLATEAEGRTPRWFTWAPNTAPSSIPFGPNSSPIRLEPSFVEAAARVLQLPDPPPDPSSIWLHPALRAEDASPYDRLRMPIAEARARRAVQAGGAGG